MIRARLQNRGITHPLISILVFLLSIASSASSYAAVLSTEPIKQLPSAPVSNASNDTAAKIVGLEGDVKILKKNSETWTTSKKNQTVESGDQILTGKNSSADIAYDNYLLNISHLKENTKAEIRSLNPTDIYLEDGFIFSALDGLSGQGGYQIATPTAVAAVRGTHFDVGYDKASQKFTAASLPTGDESHVSKIFVTDPQKPQSEGVEIIENKQLDLKRGEPIQKSMVRPADPARLEAGKAVFAQLGERMPQFKELRTQGKEHLQEMKRMEEIPKAMPSPQDTLDKKPLREKQNLFEEKRENAQDDTEVQAESSLENVAALDDFIEENKPQGAKPFGSFKPERQDNFKKDSNSEGTSSGQDDEIKNSSQGQGPGSMRPFGEMKPQSIHSGSSSRQGFDRQGEIKQNNAGFQSQQQSGGGPQSNSQRQGNPQGAPPQGNPQGPPPQGPPRK